MLLTPNEINMEHKLLFLFPVIS